MSERRHWRWHKINMLLFSIDSNWVFVQKKLLWKTLQIHIYFDFKNISKKVFTTFLQFWSNCAILQDMHGNVTGYECKRLCITILEYFLDFLNILNERFCISRIYTTIFMVVKCMGVFKRKLLNGFISLFWLFFL